MTDSTHEEERMSFRDHLLELRNRLTRIFVGALLGFFIAFAFKEALFDFVAQPLRESLANNGVYGFTAIEITETIFVYLKLSFIAGLVLTLPYTFYQLWSFVAPGLLEKEKRSIAPLVFFSTVFFLLGAYFAYEVIIPFVCDYLASLSTANPSIAMEVTVRSAFGFSLSMFLAFGFAFELPMIMFFLSFIGLVDHRQYLRFFRYFVVLSFIIGALFTPPDPVSQLLMAGPLNVLYLIGVAAAYFVGQSKAKGEKATHIPSRVWSILSAFLLVLSIAIGSYTWWLGSSRSPLEWVPADSQWAMSVRISTTLGPDASPEQTRTFRNRLGLPAKAPTTDRVVLAGNSDGQILFVFPGACEDATPSNGQCHHDDLLMGDAEWLNKAVQKGPNVASLEMVKDLDLRAPSWLWIRTPSDAQLAVLPSMENSSLTTEVESTFAAIDLRGDAPWVEVGVQLRSKDDVTALQNQVDLWRAEQARQQETVARDQVRAHTDGANLGVLSDLAHVQAKMLDSMDSNPSMKRQKASLRTRINAVVTQLEERKKAMGKTSQPTQPQKHILAKLGPSAIASWRTVIRNDQIGVRIGLTVPIGVDALLALLPEPLSEQVASHTPKP
jgi:sec-independent protein translocase protein TatC